MAEADPRKEAYAPAYIEIQEVPHTSAFNRHGTIPFENNTPKLTGVTSLNDNEDMRGADGKKYWYHFVVMAYQYTSTWMPLNWDGGDGDPLDEHPLLLGGTIGALLTPYISAIFVENIRDTLTGQRDNWNYLELLNAKIDRLVAHEIGHAPGVSNDEDHAEEGLMGEGGVHGTFSLKSLNRFRSTPKWQD